MLTQDIAMKGEMDEDHLQAWFAERSGGLEGLRTGLLR
jgi:hypothetical protein